MKMYKEEQFFPITTFFLTLSFLIVFFLTFNNLPFYENLFGFKILQFPEIHDILSFLQYLSYLLHFFVIIITYTFLHADLFHLIGNITMLLIVGLAVEEKLGKWLFLSIYIFSGNIAAIFDIIDRIVLGISFRVPFIGSSGAIFGLMAAGALIKPVEKIPTVLVLLTFLPLIQLLSGLEIFSDPAVLMATFMIAIVLIILSLFAFPMYLPLIVAIVVYMVSWLIAFLIKYPITVSNIGHLGGTVGGIVSFFLFAKKKAI